MFSASSSADVIDSTITSNLYMKRKKAKIGADIISYLKHAYRTRDSGF